MNCIVRPSCDALGSRGVAAVGGFADGNAALRLPTLPGSCRRAVVCIRSAGSRRCNGAPWGHHVVRGVLGAAAAGCSVLRVRRHRASRRFVCRGAGASAAAVSPASAWRPLLEALSGAAGGGQGVTEEILTRLKVEGTAASWGSGLEDIRRSLRGVRPPAAGLQELRAVGIEKPERLVASEDPDVVPALLAFVIAAATSTFGQASGNGVLTLLPLGLAATYFGLGVAAPGLLFPVNRAIAELLDSRERERIPRYEAAHLLVGYLLGFVPSNASGGEWQVVSGGALPTRDALAEERPTAGFSIRVANFVPPDLRSSEDPAEMDAYAALMTAGVVGEGLTFGTAEGGGEDLQVLQTAALAFLNAPNEAAIETDTVQSVTLRGAYRAALLLREHREAWDSLTKAIVEGCVDVTDCFRLAEERLKR